MIDKGEKISFAERKRMAKAHFADFRRETKARCKGKGGLALQLLIIVLIVGVLAQSSGMIQKMNKLLGESETRVHEIYDDTAVIEAYKTGNTDKLNAKDLFVYDKLTKVIDEVITEDMSDYEKEKAIYDWQVKWISYNSDNLNPIIDGQNETHTPYGVFRTHNAICVGNATTFKLFMDALGIPCKIIHSTQNGEHAWNVTQLDGDWYHVDVTFDGSYNGVPGYSYFNVPDSIKDDGSWPWDRNQIPAANGTKYCYLYTNAVVVDDFYEIPAVLRDKIEEKTRVASFILKNNQGFIRDVANYIANGMMVENGYLYFDDAYSLNGQVVYKFMIEYNDNTVTDSLTPEVTARLDEMLNEANFGGFEDGADDTFDGNFYANTDSSNFAEKASAENGYAGETSGRGNDAMAKAEAEIWDSAVVK